MAALDRPLEGLVEAVPQRSVWPVVKRKLSSLLLHIFLILTGILCLAPFYFLISGSLMAEGEMFKIPPRLWPATPIWENFKTVFSDYNFLTYLRNSVIISVSQTVGVLFFCSLAGFVFRQAALPGSRYPLHPGADHLGHAERANRRSSPSTC